MLSGAAAPALADQIVLIELQTHHDRWVGGSLAIARPLEAEEPVMPERRA